MIYQIITIIIISFFSGGLYFKTFYKKEIRKKLKEASKKSDEALLDYTYNYFKLWKKILKVMKVLR